LSALLTLHADQIALSKQQIGGACKGSLAAYASNPFLTNTLITNANTNAGLQTAVDATALTLHADCRPMAARINLGITLGLYSTELSDARINSLTTGAGLVGLTWSDPLVVSGSGYPPE
jgi:hypothetical protein